MLTAPSFKSLNTISVDARLHFWGVIECYCFATTGHQRATTASLRIDAVWSHGEQKQPRFFFCAREEIDPFTSFREESLET